MTDRHSLLAVFDPDPAVASEKVRSLLTQLERWLEWNGCHDAAAAASESMMRAVAQPDRVGGMTEEELRRFVFGIAANVRRELYRQTSREQQLKSQQWATQSSMFSEEQRLVDRLTTEHVRRCLSSDDWQLLERYSTENDHSDLCREKGVTQSALRVRIHRIRQKVRDCQRQRGNH